MNALDKILQQLPEEFTRQDFISKVGEETAYSYQHAQNMLNRALYDQKIDRVKHGVYQKTVPEFETAEA